MKIPIIPSKYGPILKFVGGKRRLLKHLLSLIGDFNGTYHEPFFGGGAVFFGLFGLGRISKAYLGDINPLLINTYLAIQRDAKAVLDLLDSYETSPEAFRDRRAELNRMLDQTDPHDQTRMAALVIFLNKTCFNGLLRVNKKGLFNSPFGRYKKPFKADHETILAAQEAFKGATFDLGSFEGVMGRAAEGDLVYLDSPYVPRSKTENFVSYSKDGFSMEQHYRLAQTFKDLTTKGVKVIASNADVPLVRELYRGYRIIPVQVGRSINSDPTKRGKVGEVIILGEHGDTE